MNDGKEGWLTNSGRYYCRKEPSLENWTSIAYYTLEGEMIPLAKAQCGACGDVMESKMCGSYVACSCGKSFVDTDRWFPESHRLGGSAQEL